MTKKLWTNHKINKIRWGTICRLRMRANSETKLAVVEKQRDEYLAGWQRAKADFINYKKEEIAHLQEVAKYGNEDLIKDLISVMDNFDLGLRVLEKSGPVEKGIYLIRSQIEDILKKRGLAKWR